MSELIDNAKLSKNNKSDVGLIIQTSHQESTLKENLLILTWLSDKPKNRRII